MNSEKINEKSIDVNSSIDFSKYHTINEGVVSDTLSKFKDYVTTKNSKVNQEFADVVSKKFQGDFAKFLKNEMIKTGRKTNTLEKIVNYFQNDNKINYEGVFEIIGLPMIDYFIKKTFGQNSMGSKINQMTPFMKKVSTGNSTLDRYVYEALGDALNDGRVRAQFKMKLKKTLDDKMNDVLDDQEFWDLMKSFEKPDNGEENIDEGKFTDSVRGVRDLFSSRETKNKFRILDDLLDNMPNLKKEIKRDIKNALFDLNYDSIDDIMNYRNLDKAAKITTIPILKNIVKNSQELYFKEESFAELIDVIKEVFLNPAVIKHIQGNVQKFLRVMVNKSREKERLKNRKK